MDDMEGISSGHILEMTPSGQVIQIDPNRVIFSNSNVALVDKRKYKSSDGIVGAQSENILTEVDSRHRRMSEGDSRKTAYNKQWSANDLKGNSSRDKLLASKRDIGVQPSSHQTLINAASSSTGVATFLYNLWKDKQMCDIVIKVGDVEFLAHKIALAASSEKFSKRFLERLCQPQDITEILLSGVSPESVQNILDYIYTYNIEINEENVDGFLSVAKQLGLTSLVDLCKRNLMSFTVNTVLLHYEISKKHELHDVRFHLDKYINDRFLDIVNTDEYKSADIEVVRRILSVDNLNVLSELDVFRAAISWIDHNRQERLVYTPTVMSMIRFVHISPQDIATHIEPTKLVFEIPECKNMLYDAFRYQALRYSDSELVANIDIPKVRGESLRLYENKFKSDISIDKSSHIFSLYNTPSYKDSQKSSQCSIIVPDTPYTQSRQTPERPALLVAGGVNPYVEESEMSGRLVELYNPKTNRWRLLAKMPDARHHHGAAVKDNCLYVIGGSVMIREDPGDLSNPTNVCYKYDTTRNTWSHIAPMLTKRMYHTVTVFMGQIYALGGQDDLHQILDSVEYFDDNAEMWINTPPMTERKIGAAAIEFKGFLYVVGGFLETPTHNFALSTVECFNPITNSWTRNNPLPLPCCHANLVKVHERLFLIGGSTLFNPEEPVTSLPSVWSYREHEDMWEEVAELRVPRHDAGAATIGSKIFIVGGTNSLERQTLREMECYDVDQNTWNNEMASLSHPCLGMTCCSISEN